MTSIKKSKWRKILEIVLLSLGTLVVMLILNFFTIKKLDKDLLEKGNYKVPNKHGGLAVLIPSKFIQSERFYIRMPLENGITINGFGDTGGGQSMIFSTTIERNDLQSKVKTGIFKGIMPINYILVDDLVSETNFPAPYPLRSFVIRHPFKRVVEPYLLIPPIDNEIRFFMQSMPDMEAFLGQSFFMGKAWTIDYPKKQIWINTPISESAIDQENVQKIGFKKNASHESIFGHPSMFIEVDGETIDVLFDTGATIVLSENGRKEMNSNLLTIGGSFIAASIFEQWRKKHPDWKYYPNSDMSHDVIEVPTIKIGGIEVGPVLFSKRPDENWSENMIHSMDKVVKGAIGGSALKYLKVTIDYNSELIKFER